MGLSFGLGLGITDVRSPGAKRPHPARVVQTGPDASQAAQASVVQYAGAVAQSGPDASQAVVGSIVQFVGAAAQVGPSPTQAAAGSVVSGVAPGGISAGLIFYQKGETASPATYLYENDDSAAEFNDGVKLLANANNPGTNDLTQATAAKRPIYLENASGGHHGLDFDGAGDPNQDALSADIANFERTDSFYGFVVVDLDSTSNYMFMGRQEGPSSYRGWQFSGAPNIYLALTSSPGNAATIAKAGVITTGLGLYSFSYDGSSSTAGMVIRKNGADVSATAVENTLSATIQTSTHFSLGAHLRDAYKVDGSILSSGLYSPAPSVGDIATIEAALMVEFGLS